ncbi:RNA polymerase sigma factor [Dactylosporangium sp. NPDC048998]|uniref:RNA polymerase sigma factor n=1 Tax=Dactylosporangium sp. NPDC048998 TaxID=3363976 RepID=UPI00372426C6
MPPLQSRGPDDPPPDLDLMEGPAFGDLFRRHARAVYNHCFRRLASWSAAEDATSIVFLEAWRRRRDALTDAGGSLLPWLLGIATNVTRNQQRAARRYATALYRLPEPAGEPDHADDVAARLDDERRMRAALELLSRLGRDEQDVVALVLLSGLTYQQAGLALGVPEGTVASRLGRARARLRALRPAPSLKGAPDGA